MKLKTKLILAFMIVMILPTLFTTVAMTAFAPKAVNDIQELYLIIVFCTASALIFWIYRTVSLPLAKLQAAARNIKEGNLDLSKDAELTVLHLHSPVIYQPTFSLNF